MNGYQKMCPSINPYLVSRLAYLGFLRENKIFASFIKRIIRFIQNMYLYKNER